MKKEPLIQTKDLIKEYVTGSVVTKALKGVNFELYEGEFVAIMGHSGSGKFTSMPALWLCQSQLCRAGRAPEVLSGCAVARARHQQTSHSPTV